VAFVDRRAGIVCEYLGLSPSWLPKIATYIRCNGHGDIEAAADETRVVMRAMKKAGQKHRVEHPWPYCKNVANQRWATAQELYLLLTLYENSMRSRVHGLLDHYLPPHWWRDPFLCMDQEACRHLLRTNVGVRARAPISEDDVPPPRNFKTAEKFLAALDITELHAIVRHHRHLLSQVPPLEESWRDSTFGKGRGDPKPRDACPSNVSPGYS
jgi:hypothetical protein